MKWPASARSVWTSPWPTVWSPGWRRPTTIRTGCGRLFASFATWAGSRNTVLRPMSRSIPGTRWNASAMLLPACSSRSARRCGSSRAPPHGCCLAWPLAIASRSAARVSHPSPLVSWSICSCTAPCVRRPAMLKLLRFIRPYREALGLVLALAFLQSLANLTLPRLMADIVDAGIVKGDTGHILRIGGVMLLIAVGAMVCAIATSFLSSRIATGFGRIVREKLFAHVEQFSLHEFDTFSTASLITRTTNDPMQIQQVLTMLLNMSITAPMMVIGGVILAATQDASLTWVLVAAMPVVALTFFVIMKQAI